MSDGIPEAGNATTDDVVALLAEIDGIGRDPERGGWSRHVFDEHETALRAWFVAHAEALGLAVETDRNANLVARWGARGPGTVLIGSHLDSVPGGGALDGPLGVASSLAAVARLQQAGYEPSVPVAIGVFAEEEGSRFGIACLGSKLMTGALDPAVAAALTDAAGVSFGEAAAAAGVDPAVLGRDDAFLSEIGAFVELHVEQGRGLADLDAPVAVASAILAHGRWRIAIIGEGNHAGATPMADRHDPMETFAALVLSASRLAAERDDPAAGVAARATIGRVIPVPGGTNVIASRVDAWLDVRADDDEATRALLDAIVTEATARAAEDGCTIEFTEESYGGRVLFDPVLRDRLVASLGSVPVLATGAGHDAGVLGAAASTGMLFVRNPTGVSHAPSETASDDDCRAGVDALVTVLRDLTGTP